LQRIKDAVQNLREALEAIPSAKILKPTRELLVKFARA
jgi:hypothetical protein